MSLNSEILLNLFHLILAEDESEWSATVVPGSLHLQVHLTCNTAASFAAQLCARERDKCVPQGNVLTRQVVSNIFNVLSSS